ncbi:Serine/threonine-protein kinase ppk15 [Choanephora cucurbitarum]|uniref:Serine/threonine-protein kinase ppk15 n=1 Tax=Choanephora cucurbitarum TaxID=101091 RepID=A0A1C7N5I1_9FUNG|nr:Serine/threonine-protein kinase ppk15 [Choanephora cucurbitarum]
MDLTMKIQILFFMFMDRLDHQTMKKMIDLLGAGTFGQVARCRSRKNELVALKVIKNKPAYTKQSAVEVDILTELNGYHGDHNVIQLRESFMFKHHLCLVFELLSINLYELLKQNRFKGLSTNLVRVFSSQLLDTLTLIQSAQIIHCDLKPENILLRSLETPAIKVIDFGSACFQSQQTYTYIQSRFYRSPEVLLGLDYTAAIDMWSFGCIVAELFLGLPLFPGSSEYNQLSRIIETAGTIPDHMIAVSQYGYRYYNRKVSDTGIQYSLKEMAQYAQERQTPERPSKRYFSTTRLDQLVLKYPMPRKNMSRADIEREMKMRRSLLDFLQKILQVDPRKRLTPQEAVAHPFITGVHLNTRRTQHRPVRDRLVHYCDNGQLSKERLFNSNSSSSSSSSSNSEEGESFGNHFRDKPVANKTYGPFLTPFISPPLDS